VVCSARLRRAELQLKSPRDAGVTKRKHTLRFRTLCYSALVAASLTVLDESCGVLYLDTSQPNLNFDEDHLQLLAAIAAVSAVALVNVRHLSSLEEEKRQLLEDSRIERNMVGESKCMREVYSFIAKAAPYEFDSFDSR